MIPAIRARLGNTDYYIASMKAGELARMATIPKEMKGWEELSLEEIYQREINYKRVKEQIAPYLAENQSRFFGAFIITMMNFEEEGLFESLGDLVKLSKGHRLATENVGLLNLKGGETLVPLDGQHRLKAIQFAISGKDQEGINIDGIQSCEELAKEDVCAILVPYKPSKAREIFTKVNRYAKTTKTSENIIIDDDDIIAVLTRMISNDVFQARLVNIKSNTLGPGSECFTTIHTIYTCNEAVLNASFGQIDKMKLPDKGNQRLYKKEVFDFWERITNDIDVFYSALLDKTKDGDNARKEVRKTNLLGKPAVQNAMVKAYLLLTGGHNPTFNHKQACRALNKIPWQISDDAEWQKVFLTNSGNMITKLVPLAIRIISYMAGENLDAAAKRKLLDDYRELFKSNTRKDVSLPPRIEN